jgi:predicted TIM-barrel fold metal-dependent hydrolase
VKIIALEEHLTTAAIARAGGAPGGLGTGAPEALAPVDQLLDLGERRLADMDDQGIDVQVLSVTTPGVQQLSPREAVPLAREANDAIAAAVRAHPDRFQGFATLPTPDPRAAADELRRTVTELGFKGAMLNGRTGSQHVDHADLEPLWAAAVQLGVPIYVHPQMPPPAVQDAYYRGLGAVTDVLLAGPGLGWHYETGIQLLRLILSGTFDRYPDLQIVVGHWGEVVLFYLERIGAIQERMPLPIERPVHDYVRSNVHVTGSGMLSHRYLRWAQEVVGVDRILYAVDYPFIQAGAGRARTFLEEADLTDTDREAIAHSNWERLTAHLE